MADFPPLVSAMAGAGEGAQETAGSPNGASGEGVASSHGAVAEGENGHATEVVPAQHDMVQVEAPPKPDRLHKNVVTDSIALQTKRIHAIKEWKTSMHQIVHDRVKASREHRKDLIAQFKRIHDQGVRLVKILHERADAHHQAMAELAKSKMVHRDEANLMHMQLQMKSDQRRAAARGQNADFSIPAQQIKHLSEAINAEKRAPAQRRDVVVPERRIHAPRSVEAQSAAQPQELLQSKSLEKIAEGIIVNAFAAVDRGGSAAPAIHDLSQAILHFGA